MTRRFVVSQAWGNDRWIVADNDRSTAVVRIFPEWIDGPDCKALAEAEADRLEAAHGPEWVVEGGTLQSRRGAVIAVRCLALPDPRDCGAVGAAFRAHICRLLNHDEAIAGFLASCEMKP